MGYSRRNSQNRSATPRRLIFQCIHEIMLEIKNSKIDGKGIFTDKGIVKGERFYNIPLDNISSTPRLHWARIGDKFIGDDKVLDWVNHSCVPNTMIGAGESPALIALCNIEAGEEITCDYNKTETSGQKYKCNCGSPGCRGYYLAEK